MEPPRTVAAPPSPPPGAPHSGTGAVGSPGRATWMCGECGAHNPFGASRWQDWRCSVCGRSLVAGWYGAPALAPPEHEARADDGAPIDQGTADPDWVPPTEEEAANLKRYGFRVPPADAGESGTERSDGGWGVAWKVGIAVVVAIFVVGAFGGGQALGVAILVVLRPDSPFNIARVVALGGGCRTELTAPTTPYTNAYGDTGELVFRDGSRYPSNGAE